ncbi:phospholipase A2 'basic'-like isoform X2 [Parasteatoda tepidariorum]|uniref:phospholipase A2 'basic'-like isoform X2 n=1 Tax=Parasteatoda tepidariorum TaxID=114398 RepID=UPI0039BCAF2B
MGSAVNATVLDLGKMMSLKTNRNPLDFVNYGNWCGLGGSGIPLDHIDRCCKMHDLCYEKIANYECYDEKPHLAHYKWKYGNGKIYCSKGNYGCGPAACRCDARIANCAEIYADSYDSSLRGTRPPFYNAVNSVLRNFNRNINRRTSGTHFTIKIG